MQLFESLSEVPEGFGPSAAVAVTFDRNPLSLIRPELCPDPLVSNQQKLELLAETGIDATLMLTFNEQLRDLPPEVFATSVLVEALHASIVFVGSDFRFGAKGAGTVQTLTELGVRLGFEVRPVDSVLAPAALAPAALAPEAAEAAGATERRASSTWVRELLGEGRVAEAAVVLGRAPSIRAEIVGGEQRGREMGYPTANLSRSVEGFVPADGVYAARILIDGVSYGAAVSIGNNPTFEGIADKTVEAHVLDQSFDLYGKVVELSFIEYIRPMNKFDGVDALVAQMNRDEDTIREILGQPRPTA
jgi:riboflavin kinase / FMN adenylyltransferase